MNSISPQMLGLSAGQVTLIKTPDIGDNQASAQKRFLRLIVRRRGVLIGGLLAGAALGLLVTLLSTRQYASTERLQISRETAQVVNVGVISHDVAIGDQEFYQTQYGLLRAQALAERVARDLGVVDDPAFFRMFGKADAFAQNTGPAGRAKRNEVAGNILLKKVVVAPVHGSSLVDIDAVTPSAALSQKIARTWAQDFIASNLERRLGVSSYARQFLEARLGQLRDKLADSERRAMDYASSEGIVDLPGPPPAAGTTGRASAGDVRSLLTDDLVAVNGARNGAATDRIQASSRLAAAEAHPDASSDALNYRPIGILRGERAAAASEYARLTSQSSPDAPAAKAAHAQIDALDAAIQAESARVHSALQQTYQAARTREQALTQRVEALKGSLADLHQRSIQYGIYQRDADTNRELYNALLQRYKEIDIAGAAASNNTAVVDEAKLPERPSSPRLALNLVLFVLAGMIVGAMIAAVLEQMDSGVTEPDAFEEKLGLPLLGAAPELKGQSTLDALRSPRSPLAEAYLAVEVKLELSTAQGAPRSLAVISTLPREGRSTTAIALAQALARARRKVVLVDADLRSPSIHAAFGLNNTAGVSDLLSGSDDIEALLRPTAYEGLWVITAGAAPPNAVDLLIGGRLARLVKQLQERFDHVIVDGPPVAGHADAPLVASAVQGVVYAVKAGGAPAGAVRAALAELEAAQVCGGVLTMTKAPRTFFGFGAPKGGGR